VTARTRSRAGASGGASADGTARDGTPAGDTSAEGTASNDADRNGTDRNDSDRDDTDRNDSERGDVEPGGDAGRGGLAVTAVAVLSAVVVALVVSAAVLLILRNTMRQEQRTRAEVLNAARQQALNIVNLDARTVDRDYDRMLAGTVDPLHAELAKNRTAAKDALTRSKGVSTGTVTDAGLIELQGDKASVVVILDTVQTNTVTKTTVSHRFRFQLDLSRQGGQWLVANLQSIDICGSGSANEPGCSATQGSSASPTPSPKPSTTKR